MRAESSAATRKGAFIAVAVALFCIQLDLFALNLAVPGIAAEIGVTVSAAQWTLSAHMLARSGRSWAAGSPRGPAGAGSSG
ncbi:hypothetical protein ACM614_22440 [Streptomyces sp. 12297]